MPHTNLNKLAKPAAIAFSSRLVSYWRTTLRTELLCAYLIGSLAHEFSRRYSDVDMALVTETGLNEQALDCTGAGCTFIEGDARSALGQGMIDRVQSATIPIIAPPKSSRSDIRPEPASQQIISFGRVVFSFGNWTASLLRTLLCISRYGVK